ncbi:MAG TPA: nucleoside-diphosphate kinase [Bryobacteraceae bacterium]|nr:nucleoside-diphosphate kinase [Bryobacteraceae bacterium]
MERTLGIIKPDAVAEGHTGEILAAIGQAGFRIAAMKMIRLTRGQAEGFYAVHRGKPFFEGLVEFMTEGPVIVMALEREGAIAKWREVMGATNPANAAEGTSASASARASAGMPRTDRTRRKRRHLKWAICLREWS